jgi:hypothetical protein
MATARGVNQGKSEFVEAQFRKDRDATHETIVEAWASSGKEGTISPSLVQKIRAKLKLTGKRGRTKGESPKPRTGTGSPKVKSAPRGRPRRVVEPLVEASIESNGQEALHVATSSTSSAHTGIGSGILDEVEGGIDQLIFTLKVNGGMPEVEEALRAARRILTRSH